MFRQAYLTENTGEASFHHENYCCRITNKVSELTLVTLHYITCHIAEAFIKATYNK